MRDKSQLSFMLLIHSEKKTTPKELGQEKEKKHYTYSELMNSLKRKGLVKPAALNK